MKRLFGVVLAAALVLGMSVHGFAGCRFTASTYDKFSCIWKDTDEKLQCFGTFETSTLTDEQKNYMRDWFANIEGSNKVTSAPFYLAFVHFDKLEEIVNVYFCVSNTRPFACTPGTNVSTGVFISDYDHLRLYFSKGSSYIHFSCPYDGDTFSACHDDVGVWGNYTFYELGPLSHNGSSSPQLENPFSYDCGAILCGNYDLTTKIWTDFTYGNVKYSGWSSSYYVATKTSGYNFAFVDDDGLIDSVTPGPGEDDGENAGDPADDGDSSGGELPEFPDSSTDDTDTTIQLPKIDYDPNLVPYDLDVWDTIPKALMPQLKKVVSIAFPIILICFGLEAFVLIVRHLIFAWLHKGGGGGGVSVDE